MTLEGRVEASLRALGVRADEPVAVACSGGADSIALLHLLVALGKRTAALHVDHGLRDGSAADAAFVGRVAERLGVEAFVETVDIVVGPGESLEAVARETRYPALLRMSRAAGMGLVATGHTLDDQAETVLLRAMRGGSLDAIAPRRGGVVRPLLDIRREELRGWLVSHGIEWREDPTNEDVRFERNWVRHVLMPQLRSRRSGVDLALARVSERYRDERAALDAWADDVFARAHVDDIGIFLEHVHLDGVPMPIRTRVVRAALRRMGAEVSDALLARMLASPPGSGPGTTGCVTVDEGVDVWRLDRGFALIERPVLAPGDVPLPTAGTIEDVARGLRVRTSDGSEPAWRWRTTVSPADRLLVRTRRAGDRIAGRAGHRKVQDVLIDAKVPRPLRDLVGIVATEAAPLAVVGHTDIGRGVSGTVVDVEPVGRSWAREMLWTSR